MRWVHTKTITKLFLRIRKRAPVVYKRTTIFLQRHPFRSFFLALGLLFGLIVLGNVLANLNKKETKKPEIIKDVSTYEINETPKLRLQAQIEATGVTKIVAQMPGVVQTIFKKEGDSVEKGQAIVYLSTTYQGGNAAALQQQLAAKQNASVEETFNTQKELIDKQREGANKTSDNASELRTISQKSTDDTRGLLNSNEEILKSIDDALTSLKNNNPGGINDALIAQTSQQRVQVLSGAVQLRGALQNLEYQAASDKPPAQLSDLQKDIALKQLDVQEKALDLSRDVSRIQLQLAAVNAQLMCPASPFAGTVERIHVREGQVVTPGTLIATVTGDKNTVNAIVQVPRGLASSISRVEPSRLLLDESYQNISPSYISQSPTDGELYTVLYSLDSSQTSSLTDGEYLPIEIPVGAAGTSRSNPFIPIDAVYQTEDEAYVHVVKDKKVASRTVSLGNVYGRYVQIKSGLSISDRVILNRNVVAGEKVKIH